MLLEMTVNAFGVIETLFRPPTLFERMLEGSGIVLKRIIQSHHSHPAPRKAPVKLCADFYVLVFNALLESFMVEKPL